MTQPEPAADRRALAACLAVAAAAILTQLYWLRLDYHYDLFINRTGAEYGLDGRSPYDLGRVQAAVRAQFPPSAPDDPSHSCGYFLPPEGIVVFAPLVWVPWAAAKYLWCAGVCLLAALAVWRLPALTVRPAAVRWVPYVAVAVLLSPRSFECAAYGQTSLLSFALVVLGIVAERAGWRWLSTALLAVTFIKPHVALPLIPLVWFLGGWRRAAALVLVVAGLNVLGCLVSTGSVRLLPEYLEYLRSAHKAVIYNRAALNPQLTSWNRLLIGLGGPVIELSAATTLAGYGVWGALVCGRVWLAGRRPTVGWALAVATVGALVCCQLLQYELVLLGLAVPHVADLAVSGRRWLATGFAAVLLFTGVSLEVVQTLVGGDTVVLLAHRSLWIAVLAVGLLAFGWPADPGQDRRR